MRIDQYLVEKGFFQTRSKAALAIKANAISVNGRIVTKNGFEVELFDDIKIIKETQRYVSRGGYKLEEAIKTFALDFNDAVVLDIGASTGGFTDCALQHGSKKVYSVDTGSNQLVLELCSNTKVINMEKTNILDTNIEEVFDHIIMDVSFVSVENMIPALKKYLTMENDIVLLVKPQFEVGKTFVKNGVVKDSKIHLKVLNKVYLALFEEGIYVSNCTISPILGGSGNKEFLFYASKKKANKPIFEKMLIK